jgi:choline kinase
MILAAGFGSRLGAHTERRHKCLVEVAGQTILSRCLHTLADAGISEACVIVGHLGDQVRAAARELSHRLELSFVENDRVATTGTAYSLSCGLSTVDAARDLLIVEADVVFSREALDRLLETPEANATLVAPFLPPISGSAVLSREDGMVRDWLHATHQDDDFPRHSARKTVNLTRISANDLAALRLAIDRSLAHSLRAPLEYAMRRLVRDEGVLIRATDVGDARWYEVDDARDLSIAKELFSRPVARLA